MKMRECNTIQMAVTVPKILKSIESDPPGDIAPPPSPPPTGDRPYRAREADANQTQGVHPAAGRGRCEGGDFGSTRVRS